ncbi:MAG TPA: type II secretion system F family protein, partial [Microlunatus sp.]|nr:type II secretion system F family protein [Microlunatus sp.]
LTRRTRSIMPIQIWAAIGVLSLALPLLAWALFSRPSRAHLQAVENLQRGIRAGVGPQDAGAVDPRKSSTRPLVLRLIPASSVRRMDRLASRAGRPAAWPLERLLGAKLVLALAAAALGVLYIAVKPSILAVLVAVGFTVLGYFLPEVLLYNQAQKRNEQINLELADTLDQMTISVEAGLGFESAMAQAGRNGTGPLAEELIRTLQDIEMGRTRRQAYEDLAERTSVDNLRRFVRAIIQADKNGIPIAEVLRVQAGEMRVKRRQRAEEKAMQIPVKVIFPLLLCIMPVLMIVVMGPAAMDIAKMFGSM